MEKDNWGMPLLMTVEAFIRDTTTTKTVKKINIKERSRELVEIPKGRFAISGIDKILIDWENNYRAWGTADRIKHLWKIVDECRDWRKKKNKKINKAIEIDRNADVLRRNRIVEALMDSAMFRLACEIIHYKKITPPQGMALKNMHGMYQKERQDFVNLNQARKALPSDQRHTIAKQNPVSLSMMANTMKLSDYDYQVYELGKKFQDHTANDNDYNQMRAFLDDKGAPARCLYMTKAERACHMLVGRETRSEILFYKSSYEPYSCNMGTCYVMDEWGCMFCYEEGFTPHGEYVNHSSFMAGRGVICAGEIEIADGRLMKINNNSGHYQPSYQNLHNLVTVLVDSGFRLDKTQVEVLFRPGRNTYTVSALTFYHNIDA